VLQAHVPTSLPLELTPATTAIWAIAATATLGVIVRPLRWPEAIWAVAGALALIVFGLLPVPAALGAAAKGTDVYLFLIGMMLLAELARAEGLFDWLAIHAVRHARGSPRRLFALVYAVGTLVTVFLSNDATAVVLTPAVYAAARAARAEPLPYLLICAFIANAASFVLPISNPANLVVFGRHMPSLLDWLRQFALPSLAAIAATYAALRFTQRRALVEPLATELPARPLSAGGRFIAWGIAATAVVLTLASALGWDLGLPTFVAGVLTAAVVMLRTREAPWPVLRHISWGVLPLVAGLFILVEGLRETGVIDMLVVLLREAATRSAGQAAWGAGILTAIACNLVNNLPAGLVAGSVAAAADVPAKVTGALLIGIDLGPNLSVTGSLATILWLVALRREGEHIGALRFLGLGLVVMPPALLLAIGALVWTGP